MICNKCGEQLPDDAAFCSNCGLRISELNKDQNTDNQIQNTDRESVQNLNEDANQKMEEQVSASDLNQTQIPNLNLNQNQVYQIPRPAETLNQNQGCQAPRPNQYNNQELNNNPNQRTKSESNIFVYSIVGFAIGLLSCIFWYDITGLTGILAIIFSSIALANSNKLIPRDKAFSIVGLITGIGSTIFSILYIIFPNLDI